jgi:hypothetical protein
VNISNSAVSDTIRVQGLNGGCEGAESTLNVSVMSNPPAAGTISGPVIVCDGSNNNIYSISSISGASNYQWTLPTGFTGNSTSNSINVDVGANASAGNIYVLGANNCGLGTQSYLGITVHKPVTPKIKIKWHDVLTCMNLGDSIVSYQWYKDGVAVSGATLQYYITHKQGGNYMVMVTDKNSCVASSKLVNGNSLKSLVLQPNPVKDVAQLSLDCEETGMVLIRLYNSLGELILSKLEEKTFDLLTTKLDISGLSMGVYFLDVKLNNEESELIKLVISY